VVDYQVELCFNNLTILAAHNPELTVRFLGILILLYISNIIRIISNKKL